MSAPPSPEPVVIVTGCPVVTACTLNPAAPHSNGDLSDDSDYLLSAWADCAAKVDAVYEHQQQPRREP
ncbi:Rz1-like lysis system protein LysC [Stutzerimonas xanthomarina]|uniref:Rz1-like lysis system protein LysC n=1 Tax=Stutzerimonas xanthomarina TaxID=271420 RepID=UPI003AA8A912